MSNILHDLTITANLVAETRKYGCKTVAVVQDFGGGHYKPHPAFRDWARRLKDGERLPRGRYFNGPKKKA
ncbi:hypothetical protein CT690_23760 [Serratia plymuthica]|uniref:Uncharacterized protein n=1 Tax=Serratia plymuthica TaxID=82996 RepID=A0A318NS42_SERPL|nr:hypothetical protein CT690_23760 [Serratia plymuthica]